MRILRSFIKGIFNFIIYLFGLNVDFYRNAYADVSNLSNHKIFIHFLRYGRREGRIKSWKKLKGEFDQRHIHTQNFNPIVYLALNPELFSLGIITEEAGAIHYFQVGFYAGLPAEIQIPNFLDKTNKPEFLDLGWSQNITESSTLKPKKEKSAALEFQDSVELELCKFDSEALAFEVYLSYFGYLPELPYFDYVVALLDSGTISRVQWLIDCANTQINVREHGLEPMGTFAKDSIRDTEESKCISTEEISIMGINVMTRGEWYARAYQEHEIRMTPELSQVEPNFAIPSAKYLSSNIPKVSVLCSMYRTDEHLVMFLNGIRKQTIFSESEFILVLVDPSDFELDSCTLFASECPNVILHVEKKRIGIYQAWNIAVNISKGKYLTNMNVDDFRRNDSLECQIKIFELFDWVDVVYQNVIVSIDSRLQWDQVNKINAYLEVDQSSLVSFSSYRNPPHNGPMWKRSLHEDLGFFDETLLSAGDFDFWFRCAAAGKNFYNTSDPHVGYFVNPEGLSTKKESAGLIEGRNIVTKHSQNFVRGFPKIYEIEECLSIPVTRAERLTKGVINHLLKFETTGNGGQG